jgi:hypothetical protein
MIGVGGLDRFKAMGGGQTAQATTAPAPAPALPGLGAPPSFNPFKKP